MTVRPGTTFPAAERDYKDARQDFQLHATLANAVARDDANLRYWFAAEVRYER